MTQKREVVNYNHGNRHTSGGAEWTNAPPTFFLPKKIFWLPSLRRSNKKTQKYFINDHMGGVKTEKKNENPAFKQIFPIFIT